MPSSKRRIAGISSFLQRIVYRPGIENLWRVAQRIRGTDHGVLWFEFSEVCMLATAACRQRRMLSVLVLMASTKRREASVMKP